MKQQAQSRGCLRRGCGCLTGGPIAFGLTLLALFVLFPQLFSVAIAVIAARQADPWPLFWSVMFLVFAQVGPRIAPALWRRMKQRGSGVLQRWASAIGALRRDTLVSADGHQVRQEGEAEER